MTTTCSTLASLLLAYSVDMWPLDHIDFRVIRPSHNSDILLNPKHQKPRAEPPRFMERSGLSANWTLPPVLEQLGTYDTSSVPLRLALGSTGQGMPFHSHEEPCMRWA